MKGYIQETKRKTGTSWRLEVFLGYDEAGKKSRATKSIPPSAGFKRRDAEKALREFIAELQAQNWVANTKGTVGEILQLSRNQHFLSKN